MQENVTLLVAIAKKNAHGMACLDAGHPLRDLSLHPFRPTVNFVDDDQSTLFCQLRFSASSRAGLNG